MEHQRQFACCFTDVADTLNIQHRRFFIPAMRRTDHDSQGGNTGFFHKALCLRDIGIVAEHLVLRRADMAELTLNRNADIAAELCRKLRRGNVLLQRQGRCVDHYAGHAETDGPDNLWDTRAVVKVHDRRLRELADGLQNGGRDKITVVGIGQTAEHLEDDRCAGFLRGFQNTHDALLRVAVERWDCAAFFFSQRKNGS